MQSPPRVMEAESDDGLLFSTVQEYTPAVVTFRVCVYCAVIGPSNTVSVPLVTVVESLIHSRSTNGDTGEGQLVRVKCNYTSHYYYVT